MDVSLAQYTVADFCKDMATGEISVNHDYQRSPMVWPPAARSFLIETILLGFPMPKIYLSQLTDIKTKKTRKEIVDGQQRSMAILDFFNNKFKLVKASVPEEAAGKTCDELDDDLKGKFLSYRITADLLIGATREDIREIFRRMNSYTVPLNAEEKRHAQYQGDFKWFVYRLTKEYAEALETIGVFREKALTRMADAKLLTEVSHALLHGITTTAAKELGSLYSNNDEKFAEAATVKKRITYALDQLIAFKDLHDTALMKPYQVYSLSLALAHTRFNVPALKDVYEIAGNKLPAESTIVENLSKLAAAVDDSTTAPKKYAAFISASESKTNTGDHRQTRFKWFCRAIENKLP
jgi:hypothetical protein